ncbi:hypothetical protein H5410_056710 [Solanum commersonii]|uniref:Uncharacterized protein n=1 Tax=Solanum commersonii TaxID=4109 RepID=A0A9J5WNH2_SOLCO|nr:hypothetical protein H5410_056710 [Solanum commersonii]
MASLVETKRLSLIEICSTYKAMQNPDYGKANLFLSASVVLTLLQLSVQESNILYILATPNLEHQSS